MLLFFLLGAFLHLCSAEFCFADSRRIFNAFSGSTVTVYSYDGNGNQTGQATGFVVRKDGVIATNYHIVSSAASVMIKAGNKTLGVRGVIYADLKSDIALLKIAGAKLPEVKIRSAAETDIEGQKIYILGSAAEEEKIILERTLLAVREIAPGRKLFRISAPVTGSLAGAPVFNSDGKVIGTVSSFADEAQSVSFAVPVDAIRHSLTLTKTVPLHQAKFRVREETAEYWFNLGAVYESLELQSDAAGAYQRAVEIGPEDPVSRNNLGVTYIHLGIYSFAVRELSEAARLKPDYQEAYYHLGTAYSKLEMHEEALESFEKACFLKPDDVKSLHGRAVALFGMKNFEEAAKIFMEVIRYDPGHPEVHYNLGVSYHRLSRTDKALESFQRSLQLNPGFPKPHFGIGVIYSATDPESALRHLRELEKLDTEGARVLKKIIENRNAGLSGSAEPFVEAADKEVAVADTPAAFPDNSRHLQHSVPASAITGAPQKKELYSVQMSYVQNRKNAEAFISKLKKKGYKAFLKEEKDTTRYRVLVGKFSSKEAAAEHALKIFKKEKMDTLVYRH